MPALPGGGSCPYPVFIGARPGRRGPGRRGAGRAGLGRTCSSSKETRSFHRGAEPAAGPLGHSTESPAQPWMLGLSPPRQAEGQRRAWPGLAPPQARCCTRLAYLCLCQGHERPPREPRQPLTQAAWVSALCLHLEAGSTWTWPLGALLSSRKAKRPRPQRAGQGHTFFIHPGHTFMPRK